VTDHGDHASRNFEGSVAKQRELERLRAEVERLERLKGVRMVEVGTIDVAAVLQVAEHVLLAHSVPTREGAADLARAVIAFHDAVCGRRRLSLPSLAVPRAQHEALQAERAMMSVPVHYRFKLSSHVEAIPLCECDPSDLTVDGSIIYQPVPRPARGNKGDPIALLRCPACVEIAKAAGVPDA
jgi:hypothetical protein